MMSMWKEQAEKAPNDRAALMRLLRPIAKPKKKESSEYSARNSVIKT